MVQHLCHGDSLPLGLDTIPKYCDVYFYALKRKRPAERAFARRLPYRQEAGTCADFVKPVLVHAQSIVAAAVPADTAAPVESFGVGVSTIVGVPAAPVAAPLTATEITPLAPTETELTYFDTMLVQPAALRELAHWLLADQDSETPSLHGDAATTASDTFVRTV